MKLALRRGAATDATLLARVAAAGIRTRLVSQFCHGGIIIDGRLYHATANHGLCDSDYSPEKWDLFDLGRKRDQAALALYEKHKGAGYDWPGILGFVEPLPIQDKDKFYCFEWCLYAMTGVLPGARATPEICLHVAHMLTQP